MNIHKIKYAIFKPVFQFLANIHWHKNKYKVTLRFLCEYAGVTDKLNKEAQKNLDKKVVVLAKAGGGYILKNSLVFPVLEYNEQDLKDAVKHGAVAIVTKNNIPGLPCIVVDNPMFLYAKMAHYYRTYTDAPVTAVVGSIGKTTTKMMLGSVYSEHSKTCYENGNFTNITHVLQLCQHFAQKYRQIICEISEANYGTIEAASIVLTPKVSVITAIDMSHMEEYGDYEEIKRQVCSISKHMDNTGVIIVNKDEFDSFEYLDGKNIITISQKEDADYVVVKSMVDSKGLLFDLQDNIKNELYTIRLSNVWGKHNIGIAAQVFAAASYLNIPKDKIIKGLKKYQPQGIRQNVYKTFNGRIIYADCYNAVAKSIESAIIAASTIPLENSGKKIAVIADVEEAGIVSEEMHLKIVDILNKSNFDTIIAYGPKLNNAISQYEKPIVKDIIRCNNFSQVMYNLKANDQRGNLILFKSSHSWHLYKCIKLMWPISFYYKQLKEKIPYLLWRISIEFY